MNTVIIRGGGDIASGIAYRLFKSGYKVVILEMDKPSTIRRAVSFGSAVYSKSVEVEGIKGILTKNPKEVYQVLEDGNIPVYIDPKADLVKEIKPNVVVDGILSKRNLTTNRKMAPITIGVGPGFQAGKDVDLVIESKRGHFLGRVIYRGRAAKDTGIPGDVLGYKEERLIRANNSGRVESLFKIGDRVEKGDIVCKIGGREIKARISGVLRGMIEEGYIVKKGLKIGDIDPRGVVDYAYTISDKALAIGGGVLEGILYLERKVRK